MLRKKKEHKGAFHALPIGETQGKEVCYRRRYGKIKNVHTKHNTQKQPTNPPKTRTRSLSTGEGRAVGQIERYVFRVTHTTHFCYTSTGPLLVPSFFCLLNTTKPTDNEKQPRYDRPHNHTPQGHTRTHTAATPRTTPPTPPTPTQSATQHTHTRRRTPARSGGAPQPSPTARSGKGPTRTAQRRTPARCGGAQHPRPSARSGRGTHTTHQSQRHKHQPQAPTKRGGDTKPQTTGTPHTGNHAHQHKRKTHRPHHHTAPPTTRTSQTRNTQQSTATAHSHKHHKHTQQGHPPRETHHHNRQAPARSGGEPHTTTAGGPQPGVAGNRTRDPQPGVARNAHHHRQRNPARSGGE